MTQPSPDFEVRLARTEAERQAAFRLRYKVFVAELGGKGTLVDHDAGLERDQFDAFADHLLLFDHYRAPDDAVVGVYRLMDRASAKRAGRFYSETEFDLAPLIGSGRALLELGRSCLHRDYRGGAAMYHLWQGLAAEIERRGTEILFGTASFHGTDMAALAEPLSLLQARHMAEPALRVRSRDYAPMNLIPSEQIDRRQAMLLVPALIKAYLRLGGTIGDGAFIDHDFNTIDVCLVMDATRLNVRQRAIYAGASA